MEAAPAPVEECALDAEPLQVRGELFAPIGLQSPGPVVPNATPWAGIGLCAAKLSPALPVDTLALLCGLERTRRALGARVSWCLLADSNAQAVGFEPDAVEATTARTEAVLRSVCRHVGFPVRFVRGSEVASVTLPAPLRALPPYEAHQLAQMRAMAQRGAAVKVGWRLSSSARDEAYFDRLYRTHLGHRDLAFVYTIGGRTFDSRRPRACPYVVTDPSARMLLRRDERVLERLERERTRDPRAARGYAKLVRKIGRELATLAGHRPHRCPEVHVQSVLDALPQA